MIEDAVLPCERLRWVLTDASLEMAGTAGDAAQLLQLAQRGALNLDQDLRYAMEPPTGGNTISITAADTPGRWPQWGHLLPGPEDGVFLRVQIEPNASYLPPGPEAGGIEPGS